jgi:hypothetical protein
MRINKRIQTEHNEVKKKDRNKEERFSHSYRLWRAHAHRDGHTLKHTHLELDARG